MTADLPRSMIYFRVAGAQFTLRVAAVCIREGRVLLTSLAGVDYWFLPGGRCEVGETSQESLLREMREELEVDVEVRRLLWVVENFFEHADGLAHELGLYYAIELPLQLPLHLELGTRHRTLDGEVEIFFEWFPLDALPLVVPPFLQEALVDLPGTTMCVVARRSQ